MTKLTHRIASSLLILALIFCPQALGGSGGGKAASDIKTGIGPAGVIESLGAVRVNGRIAQSGAILWGNELLQAPGVESAQITLGEIGLITLPGGSIIKLASVMRAEGGAPTLFAYLLTGAMTIKLNDRANARICAADSIFAFSPGSSARLLVSEGHGRIVSSNGAVKEGADWNLFQAVPWDRGSDRHESKWSADDARRIQDRALQLHVRPGRLRRHRGAQRSLSAIPGHRQRRQTRARSAPADPAQEQWRLVRRWNDQYGATMMRRHD